VKLIDRLEKPVLAVLIATAGLHALAHVAVRTAARWATGR
jgi:hypothetical protein